MTEGWYEDEYFILYSEAESAERAALYKLPLYLPSHVLVGVRSWDDFILINPEGQLCTVPTVPLSQSMVEFYSLPDDIQLEPDARFTGKIKWLVTPLMFGGDPVDESNLTWVSHDKHAELVAWWNAEYQRLRGASENA